MKQQDVWGDMELEMLRNSVELLNSDKERLLKEVQFYRQVFVLLDNKFSHNTNPLVIANDLDSFLDMLDISKDTNFKRNK